MPHSISRNPGGDAVIGDRPVPADRDIHQTVANQRPVISRGVDRLAWVFVAAIILLQWGMFRQFCFREVLWAYPPNQDQLNYLTESYGGYELALDKGALRGLSSAAGFSKPGKARPVRGQVILPGAVPRVPDYLHGRSATGFLMTLQATILYFITGPDRLSALNLNLFYFAIFQCALVATLRWMTGRWSIAFIGLGLLLTAMTPFYWAGGLTDFRFDFAGFCAFGTFLCIILRSGVFADRNWSIAAGLWGGVLFLLRFLTLVYMGGILGVTALFLAWRYFRKPAPLRRNQLLHAVGCGLIILAFAVPIIIQRFGVIKEYYIVGHVTGSEKHMRAIEQGVTNAKQAILFYPKSLFTDHVGPVMLHCIEGLLILGLAALAVRLGMRWRGRKSPFDMAAAIVFIVAALLIPLAALTSDESKSPVVANVMVAPLLLTVLLAFILLVGARRGVTLGPEARWGLPVLAGLMLCAGGWVQGTQYASRTALSAQRDQVNTMLNLYDRIGADAHAMGWRTPRFAFDTTSDAVNYRSFQVMEFERHGLWFDPEEVLAGTIFDRTLKEAMNRLSSADFAVLTEIPPADPGTYELPFDRDMRKAAPLLIAWCRQNFIELASGPIMGRQVFTFVRPAIRFNAEPDGWVPTDGATIVALAPVLKQRPIIELWGPDSAQQLPTPPHVKAILSVAGRPATRIPAGLAYQGAEYHLTLQVDPSQLPDQGKVEIALTFDGGFIPAKIGGGDDNRALVFKLPSRAQLHEPHEH